jgi:drug/metabolite transporter (DMT)-like permease
MENRRGILLMTLAMAAFAVEDAIIKAATADLPPGQIIATIGLGGFAVFAAWTLRRGERLLSRDLLAGPVLIRNLSEMTATAAYVTALSLIPLAMASAILQGVPLMVTMGAALFLGESVGWRRWTAVGVGLAGVLMIVRPGLEGFRPEALLAVVGMAALAARDVATRRVPERVSTVQLSAWAFASLVPVGALLLLMPGQETRLPGPGAAILLLGAISAGLMAYWAITAAMRVGEVSAVAPFRYTRLLFALVIAALAFGERPDALTLLGAAIVIASGLYMFLRERRMARPALTPMEPAP